MEEDKIIYKELSCKIVGLSFGIYNELGYGFQEKHYEKAFEKSLKDEKIPYKNQLFHKILFKETEIGRYYFDFLIDDKIVLELKKGNHFLRKNIDQVKGYLKVTGYKLGIIINFTPNGVKSLRILNPNNNKIANL